MVMVNLRSLKILMMTMKMRGHLQKVERVKLQSIKLKKKLKVQKRQRLTVLRAIRRREKMLLLRKLRMRTIPPISSLLGRCWNLQ